MIESCQFGVCCLQVPVVLLAQSYNTGGRDHEPSNCEDGDVYTPKQDVENDIGHSHVSSFEPRTLGCGHAVVFIFWCCRPATVVQTGVIKGATSSKVDQQPKLWRVDPWSRSGGFQALKMYGSWSSSPSFLHEMSPDHHLPADQEVFSAPETRRTRCT